MTISATLVKELRERTGAGMMECKKALQEASGDMESAVENLRKAGAAKADKKAGRIAAEGMIAVEQSADGRVMALLEVNCETDFVANDENFRQFVSKVCRQILSKGPTDLTALGALPLSDQDKETIAKAREELVIKIGENIQIRRFERVTTAHSFAVYQHGRRIGVLVELKGGSAELGKDLAMHIAASRPICVNESEVSKDLIAKEKEIYWSQAQESGKPMNIIEKMVEGRVRKFLAEVTLLGQAFVKNPDQTVEQLLLAQKAEVLRFIRMEVGEGIEKKSENFAAEVMAQIQK